MIFFYDFGDCWQFELLMEDVGAVDPRIVKPVVLESRGEPPEQYGSWDS